MSRPALSTTFLAGITALALGVAAPLSAQETAAEEETQEQTGTEGADSDLSLGEDADAPTDLGQVYVKEEVGDWELRCVRTDTPEEDPCQLYQLLEDGSGAPVAEFTLFRLPEGNRATAGATVTVPLETALTNQLTIQVDGGNVKRYPYAFCTQVGCHARIGLTDTDVNAFKRGQTAVLTIVPAVAPDQEVKLDLSLNGFTAGYDQASVLQQQLRPAEQPQQP